MALVLVLLKQLQPYLSANNLSTAPTSIGQPMLPAGKHQRGGSHYVGTSAFSPHGNVPAVASGAQSHDHAKGDALK